MFNELGCYEVCSLFEIRILLQAPPRHCQNDAVQLSSNVGGKSALSCINYQFLEKKKEKVGLRKIYMKYIHYCHCKMNLTLH